MFIMNVTCRGKVTLGHCLYIVLNVNEQLKKGSLKRGKLQEGSMLLYFNVFSVGRLFIIRHRLRAVRASEERKKAYSICLLKTTKA